MGTVAKAITFLFAAMAVYIGLTGIAVGCCFTKCPKLSKCCAFFVSTNLYAIQPFHLHCRSLRKFGLAQKTRLRLSLN